MLLELEPMTRLSPARVVQVVGRQVQLEFPDELQWSVSALAFPYQPRMGDEVLAIGQEGSWYIIGVLKGTGATTFTVPGDLSLRAPRGRIELWSTKGVHIKSSSVQIVTHKLDLVARVIMERFTNATRWVKETFQLRVGRWQTQVQSDYHLKAERILERAKEDVKIDGRKIHLG